MEHEYEEYTSRAPAHVRKNDVRLSEEERYAAALEDWENAKAEWLHNQATYRQQYDDLCRKRAEETRAWERKLHRFTNGEGDIIEPRKLECVLGTVGLVILGLHGSGIWLAVVTSIDMSGNGEIGPFALLVIAYTIGYGCGCCLVILSSASAP